MKKFLPALIIFICLWIVFRNERKEEIERARTERAATAPRAFPKAGQAPSVYTSQEEKISYMTDHYWDEFLDPETIWPSDSTMVNGVRNEEFEAAFGTYISLVENDRSKLSVENLIKLLLKYNINQIIAVDKNGQYSLVAKRADVPSVNLKSKAYKNFDEACMGNIDVYYDTHSEKMLKEMTHDTLQTHANSLGLRYFTNYDYLKKEGIK